MWPLLLISLASATELDWSSILSTELSCCPQHNDAASCAAEEYSHCVWLDPSKPRDRRIMAESDGHQCVGISYFKCKYDSPKKCCAPCCPNCEGRRTTPSPIEGGEPGYPPYDLCPAPTRSPTDTPKPTLYPTKRQTPAPVTPAPVTPAPVTPAPVTPAPVTPAPVTPAPVTPAPVTPAPVTPQPTTPQPTTQNPTPRPTTPAPVTPQPTTPQPTTGKPTPQPTTPAPTTRTPTTPAPVTPSPVTPAPVTPAPVTPAPVTPAPVTPAPVTPAPVTPAPVTPAPVTPAPVTPAPVTPAPVTPAPVTPAPVTPAPVTPAPVTPSPVTPSPVTPAPVTPAPVTPAPVTPSPVTDQPTTTTTSSGGATPQPSAPEPPAGFVSCDPNAYIDGYPCIASGDPHFITVSMQYHDFQGQPDLDGKNQFYYMVPCAGSTTTNMPYQVIATHTRANPNGRKQATGIEYITIQLFEDGRIYTLFFSAYRTEYMTVDTVAHSTVYEENDPQYLFQFSEGETLIGGTFVVNLERDNADEILVTIQMTGCTDEGADDTLTLSMAAQGSFLTEAGQPTMHNMYLTPPDCYKCHSCGLCGDYKRESSGLQEWAFEICNGELVDVTAGTDGDENPAAYDMDGWTYETNYWDECPSTMDYDINNNTGEDFEFVPLCDEALGDATAAECASVVAAYSECCATLGGLCEDLQSDCETDACAMADNSEQLPDIVDKILRRSIQAMCRVPRVGNSLDRTRIPKTLSCPTNFQVKARNRVVDQSYCVACEAPEILGYDTIEDCAAGCDANPACLSFVWSDTGGDLDFPDSKTCRYYNTRNAEGSANEDSNADRTVNVMCILDPSCGLYVYVNADDTQTITYSQDGGDTFYPAGLTFTDWRTTEDQDIIGGVSTDTIVRFEIANNGATDGQTWDEGGFMATIKMYDSKTKEIVHTWHTKMTDTDQSVADIKINEALSSSVDISALSTIKIDNTNTNRNPRYTSVNPTNNPDQDPDAAWIWDEGTDNTIVFEFDMQYQETPLQSNDCFYSYSQSTRKSTGDRNKKLMVNSVVDGAKQTAKYSVLDLSAIGMVFLAILAAAYAYYYKKVVNKGSEYEQIEENDEKKGLNKWKIWTSYSSV